MSRKFLSLLLSILLILGTVTVPVGAVPVVLEDEPPAEEPITYYIITFQPNNSNGSDYAQQILVEGDKIFTFPGNAIPVNENGDTVSFRAPAGMEFVGWSQNKKTPKLESKLPITKNITVYAIWRYKDVNVTFNPNGGKFDGSAGDTQTVKVQYGSNYENAIPSFPSDPIRDKFKFDGWYTAQTDGTLVTAKTRLRDVNDHTLYAHWLPKFEITFDPGDGAELSDTDRKKSFVQGDRYVLPTPTKAGSTFEGWFSGKDGTGTQLINGSLVPANSPGDTFYAKWAKAVYSVTLDPDCRDTISGLNTSRFNIRYNQTYAEAGADVLAQTPARTGYTFLGWFTESVDGGSQITKDSADPYTLTDNQTLYAHWQANTYTITYDYAFPEGAYWGAGKEKPRVTTTSSVTYGERYPELYKPAEADIPYYSEDSGRKYIFDGWYTAKSDEGEPGTKIIGDSSRELFQTAGNQTLYARWKYNVEFYANHTPGTGTEKPLETKIFTSGTAVGPSNLPRTPTRLGYEFAGWYDTETGSTQAALTADTIANPQYKKLYAHWAPGEFTIKLDANGGAFDNEETSLSYPAKYGSTYGKDGNGIDLSEGPARAGFDFDGWYTEAGDPVKNGDTFETLGPITLYAHWAPVKITLNFDYNFPGDASPESGYPSAPGSATVTYGALYGESLPLTDPAPFTAANGVTYSFAGWYTTPKDENADAATGREEVTGKLAQSSVEAELDYDNSHAAPLYARWNYEVNFYANIDTDAAPQAESETPCCAPITVTSGSRYGELPGEPEGNPSKYFLGWSAQKNGGGLITEIDIADGVSTAFYAQWGETRTCTISLDGNGVDLPDSYVKSELILYGDTYSKLLNRTPDPTREGYDFAGWYLDESATGDPITAESIVAGDCTLYAKWTLKQYTITLNLNYAEAESLTATTEHNSKLADALPAADPERSGYAFDGWFKDTALTELVDETDLVTADVTLYAKWVESKTVQLVLNDGSLPEGTSPSINTYAGGIYKLPTPTKFGYDFAGWFTAETGGTQAKPGSPVITDGAGDPVTPLYARWNPKRITVSYDYNGGNGQRSPQVYSVGGTYNLLPNNAYWNGHRFMGWYTKAVGGDRITSDTVVALSPDSPETLSVTLYAHWGYAVAFDPGIGSGTMDSDIAEMNQPYILPACTFTPPAGMLFAGWAVGTAQGEVMAEGDECKVDRILTLYATWTDAPVTIRATCSSGGSLLTTDGLSGTFTVSCGENVSFVTRADPGYVLKELLVDGVNYHYTESYTFKNVTKDHMIHAVFEPIAPPGYSTCDRGPSCPFSRFRDLNPNAWYHDAIHYCIDNLIMNGTGYNSYSPNISTTRAMVVTALWNYAGRPSMVDSGYLPRTYSDVTPSEWYYQPIEWATSQGVLTGYSDGRFGPNDSITREQLVTILWRHAGRPSASQTSLNFNDASSVSSYARKAMLWATEEGIVQGRSPGYLSPQGTASRAEIAQMLKRYLE